MFWLYLLGAVTFLIIVLRRVLRRQKPLTDEVHSSRVAIDNVQSGVAWIGLDGKLGSVNQSLAKSLGVKQAKLMGAEWMTLFAAADAERVAQAYSQMLLQGKSGFKACGAGPAGDPVPMDVLLVAVHNHKLRFVGHHCLIRDCTGERESEICAADTESSLVPAR
ncbi:MAG TPA: PAS domain-containing protein [Bryobacteraceae bacterium]|jgi:PAS domain S-box-containing protein|nr:PAS domain-containing protein [Bryobacteraceae bacterium]